MPTARAAGPIGGRFMGQFTSRAHYPQFMLGAGLITVASGLMLYRDFYSGLAWQLARPGPETVFGIGGLIAILVALVASTIFPRMARRVGGGRFP